MARQSWGAGVAGRSAASEEWLTAVGDAAATAAQAPAELLGEYLPLLADAAIDGRRPDGVRARLPSGSSAGAPPHRASERRAADLYVSAAWRLWRRLPVVVRSSDPEKVRRGPKRSCGCSTTRSGSWPTATSPSAGT